MPSIQLIALTALCVHYSTLTILMHLSRTAQQTSTYRASSAVVMTELSKLIISFILALYDSFQQETQPTSRPSPHSRFEPQFDSLPEEDEEGDDLNPFVGSEQLEGIEMTDREIWRTEDSRRNEDSDHLISDMLSQLQSNPSNARERTISSEVYMPSQAGQRRRLISGNGTTSPDKPAFHLVPPISDHSHRMSVQASPQLTRPSQNHHSPSHSLSRLLDALGHLRTSVFSQDWLCLGIPAVMFVVQNNLQYLAASNLSVPLFQMTYQLKILTTALCSVLLLKRRLKKTQWASLIILATGVAIVQLSSQETSRTTEMEELSEGLKGGTEPMIRGNRSHKMNQLVGLMAVVSACLSSGFASVYLERLLKSTGTKTSTHSNSPELNKKRAALHPPSPASVHKPTLATPSTSIWIRNIQLSSFGLIVSILIVILENHIQDPIAFLSRAMRELVNLTQADNLIRPISGSSLREKIVTSLLKTKSDFFLGFSNLTWLVIFFQVIGGILNSIVMKFSNNINKNFSICLSIILSIFLSNIFLSSEPTDHLQPPPNHLNFQFFVGASFVIFSTWLFNI